MASRFPPAPASPPPAFWTTPQPWAWPPPPRPASPASSPESAAGSLSPADAPLRPAAPRRRGRLGDGQRQSASQREKLRMRRLARALHTLRRFLPPSVAPAGRSLTKVETLRLAARYIEHLARLLGPARGLRHAEHGLPTPDALALPRRSCLLCPPGLACAQPVASPPPPRLQLPTVPCCLQTPAAASTGLPAPGPVPVADAAAWLAAEPYCSIGSHVEELAGSSRSAAQPLHGEDFASQGLPAELLAFLDSFLPPPDQR